MIVTIRVRYQQERIAWQEHQWGEARMEVELPNEFDFSQLVLGSVVHELFSVAQLDFRAKNSIEEEAADEETD